MAGDMNVFGDIPSCSFGYLKQCHLTNDSEFVILINPKFPLPYHRSWQGFFRSFPLNTKVISDLGTRAYLMREWKRLRRTVKKIGGSGMHITNPSE